MYQVRFYQNLGLGTISDLTLTFIPFHCTAKLLDNFYWKRFKTFCVATSFLINKTMIDLLKVYMCKCWLVDKTDASYNILKFGNFIVL